MIIKTFLQGGVFALIMTAYMLGPEPANAQTGENLLGGIKKVAVIVNTMFDSKQCDVRANDVKATFIKLFDGSGMEITDSSIDVAVKITVKSVAPVSKTGKVIVCVSIIDLEAWSQTGYRKLRFNKSSTITRATVYNETIKVVSEAKEHSTNVDRLIGEMAARFIKNHALDN